jgi:ATP-dependent Lon protease
MPITITRDKSIQAVHQAYKENKRIAVITQKDANVEDPGFKDLYKTGTIARIS